MFSFKVDTEALNRDIWKITKWFKDWRPLLQNIETYQQKALVQNFDAVWKTVTNWNWAPLSLSTLRKKKTNKILVETWKMRWSFATKSLTNKDLEIWNTAWYSKYHQTGTRKMPQRQILGHWDEMIKEVEKIAEKYFNKLFK